MTATSRNRMSVSSSPASPGQTAYGAGQHSSPHQPPPRAGVDQSAARRESAASVSADGDTYTPSLPLVRLGQGTSETEVTEPAASDAVEGTAGWASVLYAAALLVLGAMLCAAMT